MKLINYLLFSFFTIRSYKLCSVCGLTTQIYLFMVTWLTKPSYIQLVYLLIVIDLHVYLADAFIQSDLQCIQVIHFLSVCVFPGNRTHNLDPLSHRNTPDDLIILLNFFDYIC